MVEKINKKKNGGQPPENGCAGGKNNVTTVVLKADLHCEGCVHKVLKCIRSFDGVDTANIGDGQRITVVGKVDPAKLRQKVEEKTHKKVELVSPQNKKDDNKNKDSSTKGKENSGGSDNAKQDKNNEEDQNSQKKNAGEKKPKQKKEIPVSTAVLKVHLHCEGCIQKICKLVTKTKGYQDVKVDRQKGLVTVTGAIDMKALAQVLKKHLKRDVEVTPPAAAKKDAEKKENSGGGGGEKGKGGGGDKGKGGGGNKGESGGGDKAKSGNNKGESGGGDKVKSGGDGGENSGEMGAGGEKMEGNNRIQFQVGYPYPYTYEPGVIDQFHYNMYAFGPYHAPQMFSDENPNACTIM